MTVPTPTEDVVLGTLEDVRRTGEAPCRLCGEAVDVGDAESWGDVFDALAAHGVQREDHIWHDIDGWTLRGEAE